MDRFFQRRGRIAVIGLMSLLTAGALSLRPLRSNAASADSVTSNSDIIDASDTLDLTGLQGRFQQVAEQVAPAVVSISAAETACDSEATHRASEMSSEKLQALLDKTTRTIGTGFIIEPDGFIVTNEHVVEDSQQFWVTTDDHRVFPAIVVGADPRADIAVLKIPAMHLPVVRFAREACRRGEWAITLGNPFGLATEGEMALSVGVVSATQRSLPKLASKEDRLYSDLIQTTAQINPGNSGGPLIDLNGNVIGIDTAVILPQKQTNGIGFALPINTELLEEVAQLEQGREVVYGYVGVTVSTPSPKERTDANMAPDTGVMVDSVEEGSPAACPSGLLPGDMIASVNGYPIVDTDHFVRIVGSARIEKPSTFVISRGGKALSVQVTPVKRPVQYAITNQNQRLYWRGMVLGSLPSNWPASAGSDKHSAGILVVGIQDDSPLKSRGVNAGAVITAIGGQPIKSLIDLQRVLNDIPPEKCDVQLADQVVSAGK
jgi:serine protease Do